MNVKDKTPAAKSKTKATATKTKVKAKVGAAKAKATAKSTAKATATKTKVKAKVGAAKAKVGAAKAKATAKSTAKATAAKTKVKAKAGATKTVAKPAAAKASTAKPAAAKPAAKPAAKAGTPKKAAAQGSVFAGKTVVLTGTFATMKRAAAEALLAAVGAKMSGSISAKTDLLIHGADAGSKLSKARGLGVATMTEPEMVALLQGAGAGGQQLAGAAAKMGAQREAEDKKLGAARPIIDAVNKKQIAKYGRTIPQLLRSWIRLFAQRPDIHVMKNTSGAPTSTATVASLATRLPPEVLALAAESGPLHFWWVFADMRESIGGSSEGHNGGRINLVGFKHFRWWDRPTDWDWVTFKAQAMFDELQAEGSTMLSYDPGQSESKAMLVFDDANDVERHPMGTVESYLTDGARRGFVWYWPKLDYWEANDYVARLFKKSIPRTTPGPAIRAGLMARGIDAAEAEAIWRWLGRDAVLLLPK